MFSKVKELSNKAVSWWKNDLTTMQKVGLILLAASLIANFTYAGVTGFWFMNPFNGATWTGAALNARIFYGICGTAAWVGGMGMVFGRELQARWA